MAIGIKLCGASGLMLRNVLKTRCIFDTPSHARLVRVQSSASVCMLFAVCRQRYTREPSHEKPSAGPTIWQSRREREERRGISKTFIASTLNNEKFDRLSKRDETKAIPFPRIETGRAVILICRYSRAGKFLLHRPPAPQPPRRAGLFNLFIVSRVRDARGSCLKVGSRSSERRKLVKR